MESGLKLNFELEFVDLYEHSGVNKIDREFLSFLETSNSDLHRNLLEARANSHLNNKTYSDLITNLAPYLEQFIAKLFRVEKELLSARAQHLELEGIYKCKRLFVQRQAIKDYKTREFDHESHKKKLSELFGGKFDEITFARNVMNWLNDKESYAESIEIAKQYAAWATLSAEGQELYKGWILFQVPKKLDPLNLVNADREIEDGIEVIRLADEKTHSRDNFNLTDPGPTLVKALDQAHYCIFCHNQGRDSCSKGLGSEPFKKNAFGEELAGCPLGEKISEMNFLKSHGFIIAPLAAAVIDNPMVAATGDRICNDCMKSCIYQKQEPVDIPKVESRVLRDALALPWGFEIYSLLTRWNPLNIETPIFKPDTNRKVLVAGLGPAGFTLSHYLLNEGHTVVAIDGLKIEPSQVKFEPIRNIYELFEELDQRTAYGFGGVAEYGITVRWNKNFLKIIRLLLERRKNFKMYGGVRFGSQITYDSAFALGFDHIALALGAGKPNLPEIPNRLALGIRTASDFLMSLQLIGAAKQNSVANLQIRLPLIVIGGGLTAIDTATEAITYYIRQVTKFKQRYDELVKLCGVENVKHNWSELDSETAKEFLEHAALFETERAKSKPVPPQPSSRGREAAAAIHLFQMKNQYGLPRVCCADPRNDGAPGSDFHGNEGNVGDERLLKPNFIKIIRKLGGVKILYRKLLTESPSYRLNPEEVNLAFKEGIEFIEEAIPLAAHLDEKGRLDGMMFQIKEKERFVKAKSVLLAIGTSPNTVLHREDPAHFSLYGKYFITVDESGKQVLPEHSVKPKKNYPLMSIDAQGRAVSFFGDLHPSYAGNVVKAMASAKNGYKVVSKIINHDSSVIPAKAGIQTLPQPGAQEVLDPGFRRDDSQEKFFATLDRLLLATIHGIKRLTPNIIEVVVKAPLAAREFKPGQFYRLQNYEMNNKHPAMEGIALTGASVDLEKGLLSTIVLEMGGSSSLCQHLKKDEPVVLMGPTGAPTEIKGGEFVLLVGGGLGNAVLFSIGKAFRAAGSKVLYFAGYKRKVDRFKTEEIEAAADQVIWCCDEGLFDVGREQDLAYHGNVVEALNFHASLLHKTNRIIAIGSDGMMNAVNEARKHRLPQNCVAIASINSPMQCMMKEICGQCIQKHIDPSTGIESYIYSCTTQDQDMNHVDFAHLKSRLNQNSLSEKLTAKWLELKMRF